MALVQWWWYSKTKMLELFLWGLYTLLTLGLVVAGRQLLYAVRHFTPPVWHSDMANDTDVPSVSVCIPARNEQHALTGCLEAVLGSRYPKLEILVLDDVSGDNTPTLIKSFASEGVRFIQGCALPRGWLGKNHALQQLLEQASGSYVLFLDVDTRLAPDAIGAMVRYLLSERASMVSVLPRREDGWRASVVASPLRYFWEVIFHRRLWPATASNAWMIRRSVLNDRFQGLIPFKAAIQPETKLAAELAETGEYRFIMSTRAFGVAYEKKWRSQLLTSVRLLYSLMGQRLAVSILAVLGLCFLLVPPLVLVNPWAVPLAVYTGAAVLSLAIGVLYAAYTRRVWRRGWWVAALLWPLVVVQELTLAVASFVQYKRKAVTWKGRSVQSEAQN